jgi:hypothetical protein
MKWYASLPADLSDLANGINRPDFIVGVNHRDNGCVWSQAGSNIAWIHPARLVHRQHFDLKAMKIMAAWLCRRRRGAQPGRSGYGWLTAAVLMPEQPRKARLSLSDPHEVKITHLAGSHPEGDSLPGLFNGCFGFLAEFVN